MYICNADLIIVASSFARHKRKNIYVLIPCICQYTDIHPTCHSKMLSEVNTQWYLGSNKLVEWPRVKNYNTKIMCRKIFALLNSHVCCGFTTYSPIHGNLAGNIKLYEKNAITHLLLLYTREFSYFPKNYIWFAHNQYPEIMLCMCKTMQMQKRFTTT